MIDPGIEVNPLYDGDRRKSSISRILKQVRYRYAQIYIYIYIYREREREGFIDS